ncbi:MAG TPA: SDR family oxidoreductase [Acetobacteraceae bacterium]|jgi:NAD(P)-dependent dehydrogenase (short-subunit alcohol dehydrogenase family)|nr:SDR family oxidoreductase [Acetobacteraceae bacterium]
MELPISERLPRTALVTGGARRVGRAITLALAAAGFDIAIHAHTGRAEAEALAGEIGALGRQARVVTADLAREEEVQALYPAASSLGPIGLLINNASTFERDEWDDATRTSWDRHLEPNLRAPFVLTQHFARALPAAAEGVVVNLLDERVWALTPHFVSYTVSKMGLWTLTRTLALALAPRIRVAGIGPGPTLPSARQTPAQFARQMAAVPLKHGPTPEEVARAVLMILALPSFTGQMLALDGGQHLRWATGGAPIDE